MDISIRMTQPGNIAHFGHGIITMPLEEYLLGVVPQEMSDSAPMEALKAQAICARSYALRKIQQGIIMDDTSKYQAYSYPRSLNSPRSRQAVEATAGKVLTFSGKLAACYYSSTNNGRTKPVEEAWKGSKPLPYSVGKRDPWDIAADDRCYLERSHGVGMSQTGAKYAAMQGVSCEAILTFYFPGCTIAENYGETAHPTLRLGDRGEPVRVLQAALTEAGFLITVDGIFGVNTLRAVTGFQKARGLKIDGIAGEKTWEEVTK